MRPTTSLWQNDEANYNNWRGAQGAFYSWNSAGMHSYASHNASFNTITTDLNQTYGTHWDTDHLDIATNALVSSSNLLAAGFLEASEGPLSISNSYLCNSGTIGGGGLKLRDAAMLTLTNDVLYDSNTSQIMVTGTPGGSQLHNFGDVYAGGQRQSKRYNGFP